MRNGSLWSNVDFQREVIFHEFDLKTSELDFEVSNSSIWKHTLRVKRVFFLLLLSRNFDDKLSSNFHRCVILCIFWDTPREKTGHWQLPIVFNPKEFLIVLLYCASEISPSTHFFIFSFFSSLHYSNDFMIIVLRIHWNLMFLLLSLLERI